MIAELNLGFWNSLFENHHYALLKGVPCKIFKGLPAGYGRKEVNEYILKIRTLRNRISHNEPLCFDGVNFDTSYAKEMYSLIEEFLSWIDPNILKELQTEQLDKICDEIKNIDTIIKS